MKKLLIVAATALILCSCVPAADNVVKDKCVPYIVENLKNPTEWNYTYKKLEPNKNVYIIDFYTWEPISSYSQWLYSKSQNNGDCKLLSIVYYY